jgi:prepilin-type N-terminal cleavage/methylation domain-containing protein
VTINNKIKRVKNHEREKYIEKIEKANFSFDFLFLFLNKRQTRIKYLIWSTKVIQFEIIVIPPNTTMHSSARFTTSTNRRSYHLLHTRAFTLIELMVVITIIGILFVSSYVPYDHYSRLSRVRISTERFKQTLEDARILAQNGQIFPGTTKNANIGILLQKNSPTIDMYAMKPGTRSFTGDTNTKKIKSLILEDGVNITYLPEDSMLLEYSAPNGTMEIYKSPTQTGATFSL